MSKFTQSSNKKTDGHGRLAAVAGIIAAAVIVTILVLIFKSSIYYSLALGKVRNNEFTSSLSLLERADSEKAEVMKDYVNLRLDINRNYSVMISSFDIEVINNWNGKVDALTEKIELFPADIGKDISALSEKLKNIVSINEKYQLIRSDVLSALDVFNELNRLYAVDASGNRTTFTVAEENAKAAEWENRVNILSDFSSQIPGGDTIYLLSYLISETRSECADIREAMQTVLSHGYTETDSVRISGSGQKQFPDITNSSGTAVNVTRKEEYEEYMYAGICRALVETLAGYYTGIE